MTHDARVLSFRTTEELRGEIERIGAAEPSPLWMAEKATAQVVRLERVPGKAANILKQEMLTLGGDCALSREVAAFDTAPRPCLLLGSLRQYRRLLRKLSAQPFGLPELGAELDTMLRRFEAPIAPLRCYDRVLPIGERTLIMGILNLTPDSFSGDGLAGRVDEAVRRAEAFAEAGADIIDLGGESTKPGSEGVSAEEELARVVPALEAVRARTRLAISIDTSKPEVARAAAEAGAHIVNDVNAARAEGMAEVVAELGMPIVLMHMLGRPRDMQNDPHYDDLLTEVYGYLAERMEALTAAGVEQDRIVVDPGIGFGKTVQHNLELIRRLRELRSLGRPILVGPSRKRTIGTVLGGKAEDERQWGTAALVAASILGGADIVRVHDVAEMAQVARMIDAVMRGWDAHAHG